MSDETLREDTKENTERIIAIEQQVKTLFSWREEFRQDCLATRTAVTDAIQHLDDRINQFSNHKMAAMRIELMKEIRKVKKTNGKNGLSRGDIVIVAIISGLTSIVVALITYAAA